jgi:hypothetical protein
VGGISSDALILEIGGSTVVFLLSSPSAVFFCGTCLSISETVATDFFGGGAGVGAAGFSGVATFVAEGAIAFAGALVSAGFFFGAAGFAFDPADLWAAAVLRAGVFAAVLLVVFVAI